MNTGSEEYSDFYKANGDKKGIFLSKLAERLPGEESKNVVVEVEKLSDGSYTFKTATITDQ